MRIGLTTAAFYGQLETEEAARKLAQMGVSCCEVFLETYSEYSPLFAKTVKHNLADVPVTSIHSKTQHFEGDFFGQSARQRTDAFALLDGFLDAGQVLGAGIYVYHGPADVRGKTPRFENWQEGISRAIRSAAARGIDFAWEVVSWCHLNTPERARLFRKLWPDLHFVLDTKQIFDLGQDVLDYVDAMGDKLCHVHILDVNTDGRYVLPGEGIHDFRPLAHALHANGYSGDVILEPYGFMGKDAQALLDSIDWIAGKFNV